MKFLRIVVMMAVVGFGSVNAEQNGWFVGGDLGYNGFNIPLSYTQTVNGAYDGGGAVFAFVGGYKQFFTPYFGLRYYGNFNLAAGAVSPKDVSIGQNPPFSLKNNRSIVLVNYAANVDLLANFIVREKNQIADFGAFLGLGLGGNSWGGKVIDDFDDYIAKAGAGQSVGFKATRNFFDISLNVGLRTTIYTNHGAELSFRVPIGTDTFLNKQGFNIVAKNGFNMTLRYTYTFGQPRKVKKVVVKKRKRPSIEERLQQADTQTQKRRKKSNLDMDEAVKELEKELGDI